MNVRKLVRLVAIPTIGILLPLAATGAEELGESAESVFDLEWCAGISCQNTETLDPAIFTEVSPVTSSENAVKLPSDDPADAQPEASQQN
jgi:hypothetical protein